MSYKWIINVFKNLLHALDDMFDIIDMESLIKAITMYDQVELTKQQLERTGIVKHMTELLRETPNKYLKHRLELVLTKWRGVLLISSSPMHKPLHPVSNSVFEAIIKDDDKFFKTKSVPELLQRLSKSLDKKYRVTDMATVLNTIDVLEGMNISASILAQTDVMTYIRRLRRNTTNRLLADRLRLLLRKWRNTVEKKRVKIAKQKRRHG